MFKKLIAFGLGVCLAGAAHAVNFTPPTYVTTGTVPLGILTVTPQMQDVSSKQIVISKDIYDLNWGVTFTTLTLQLFQDEKAKLTGTAKFQSSRPSEGLPQVNFPVEFPVVGSIKNATLKLKGKTILGEAGSKRRKLGISINGPMINFVPNDLSTDNVQSTATYRLNVKVTGIPGSSYNYLQDVENVGDYFFIYQYLPLDEALGLKFPKGGDLYKIRTPFGYTLAKAYVSLDEQQNTVLTLKGNKFQYTGIEWGGNLQPPFNPNFMSLKTSYGKTEVSDPGLFTDFYFFDVFDGGPRM